MSTIALLDKKSTVAKVATMRATVFHGVDDIRVEEVPRPHAGLGEALIRVTLTTILRNGSAHRQRRISGEARTDHRT